MAVRHLKQPSKEQWTQIQLIYEASFADYERDPIEDIVSQVNEEELLLFTMHQDEEIIGLALVYTIANGSAFYLPYFAVSPHYRSQGIGSKLLTQLVQYLSSQSTADALVWEVEPPLNNDANDNRNKRIRFYERSGGRHVDLVPNYRVPLAPGIVPYWLYWISLREQNGALSVSIVSNWIKDIYAIYYPERRELLREILSEIEQTN